jgi:hypothetical protein
VKTSLLPKVSGLVATFVLTLVTTAITLPYKSSFSQGITIDGKESDNSPRDRLVILIHDLTHHAGAAEWMPPSTTFVYLHRPFQQNRQFADDLEVSSDQEAKIKQMLELTKATLKASFRRDLETLKTVKGPTKAQMDQLEQQMELSSKRRNDAIAAADRFLLTGVLSESQAEMLTKFLWASQNAHALKDDVLARRLNLDPEQRALIARRLEDGDRSISKADNRMIAIGKMSNEADRALQEARETRKAAEDRVWEVLRPQQLDQWKQIIQSLPKEWPKKR